MSGLGAVIARVGEIQDRIVALDPTAAVTAASTSAQAVPTTDGAAFAEALEAATAAAGVGSTTSVIAGHDAPGASAANAQLVSALQAAFAATTSGAPGGSNPGATR